MQKAELLLKIQHSINTTNWSRVGVVYEGFQYSIIRHYNTIEQEINNLHVLFLLQSGKYSKDKTRVSGRLVKALEGKEITLISLEKTLNMLSTHIDIFHEILIKAVPDNFDSPEEEKSRMLSDLSEGEGESQSEGNKTKDMQSFVEDQLLTNESKAVYLINYLHSFITINCSNIMDRELIEIIIEIFLDTLVPYLEIMNSWFSQSYKSKSDSNWSYDTTSIELPKFLKPFMREILQIRKSLMVIHIVKEDLMMNKDKEMEEDFGIDTTV